MPKMREFKFTDENDEPIEGVGPVESMSFKRAVKSVQGNIKNKWVIIEYLTKKGKEIRRFVQLPIGRKRRLG